MRHDLIIQLPSGVEAAGYKQTRPYHWEQVFHSPEHGFTGTEYECYRAGLAYKYLQVGSHKRHCWYYPEMA